MTELLYLNDFDVETAEARVQSVATVSDEEGRGKVDIALDQTCFYPRGGGQDWDQGTISNGSSTAVIQEVRLDEDGVVHHYCDDVFDIKQGDVVTCIVDHERRHINTRLHSAGHMIDMAVADLGYDWQATKGQHYPHLSAVEYSGDLDGVDQQKLQQDIESKANQLQHQEVVNRLKFVEVSDLKDLCRHVPDNIPTNKPCRVVIYGQNFGVPCGGTHVKHLTDIGKIYVPKVKSKKGVIRVNYSVEGIN